MNVFGFWQVHMLLRPSLMEGLPPALSSDDDEVQGNNEAEEVEESDDEIDHSFEFGGILVSLDVSHDQRRTC